MIYFPIDPFFLFVVTTAILILWSLDSVKNFVRNLLPSSPASFYRSTFFRYFAWIHVKISFVPSFRCQITVITQWVIGIFHQLEPMRISIILKIFSKNIKSSFPSESLQ